MSGAEGKTAKSHSVVVEYKRKSHFWENHVKTIGISNYTLNFGARLKRFHLSRMSTESFDMTVMVVVAVVVVVAGRAGASAIITDG